MSIPINKYPYTDLHELNLDYVLKSLEVLSSATSDIDERVEALETASYLKYGGAWDISTDYSSMCIVDDGNGALYLSLQEVPAGTALNDTTYWKALAIDYSTLITALSNRVTSLEGSVKALEITGTHKDIICIGDSYGLDSAGWSGWGHEFANIYTGGNVYVDATGGAGWVNASEGANFLQTLQRVVTNNPNMDHDDITDIVVLGGYNDMATSLSLADCKTAMSAFKTYVESTFPYATVHFGCIAFDYNSAVNQASISQYARTIYPSAACEVGIDYYDNFMYTLLSSDFVYLVPGDANSGFHPNTAGCENVANYLLKYIKFGRFDVIMGFDVLDTFVYSRNGVCALTPSADQVSILNAYAEAAALTYPLGTWVTVKDLTGSDHNLWGTATTYPPYTPLNGNCLWYDYYNNKIFLLRYRFSEHVLQFMNLSYAGTFNPANLNSNNGYIIQPITVDPLIAY